MEEEDGEPDETYIGSLTFPSEAIEPQPELEFWRPWPSGLGMMVTPSVT